MKAQFRQKEQQGALAYHSGDCAETGVAERYAQAGYQVVSRRWRSAAGEIDLILRQKDLWVFVEVKKARNADLAALRLDRRQMNRICQSACCFCEGLATGSLTEMRFDVALVDGFGRVEIIENAFGEH